MAIDAPTTHHTTSTVVRSLGRYAVLLNARAKGWSGSVHHSVQRFVTAQDLFLTDSFRQARQTLDRLLASSYDVIFTAGGDGTVMYLVNEIEQRVRRGTLKRGDAPCIGVLRLGTGNAIASYLGCDDMLSDLRALQSGAPLTVHDVHMIEDSGDDLFPFAGIGWDADILNDYDVFKTLVRDTVFEPYIAGLGGYGVAITTRTLPRAIGQKPIHVTMRNLGEGAKRIDYEGNVLREYDVGEILYDGPSRICGASSIPYWGFQVRMFPQADASPDHFQLRCYHGTVCELLTHLRDFWRGRMRETSMHDFLVQKVRVEIQGDPVPYQISGDASGVERSITWALAKHPIKLAVALH